MIDINRHRYYLVRILKDIYTDITLGNFLGFNGGTALMFFYELPRFSVNLDFNLLAQSEEEFVFKKFGRSSLNTAKYSMKHRNITGLYLFWTMGPMSGNQDENALFTIHRCMH
jgi:hypothetical protein